MLYAPTRVRSAGERVGAIPLPTFLPVYVTRSAPVGSRPGIRPSPVRHLEAPTATQNSTGIGTKGITPILRTGSIKKLSAVNAYQ